MISKVNLHRRHIIRVATMGTLGLIANSATCAVKPDAPSTKISQEQTAPKRTVSVAHTVASKVDERPTSEIPLPETVDDAWGFVSFAPTETILIGCASSTSEFNTVLTAGSGHKLHHIGTDIQNAARIAVKDRPLIKGFQVDLLPMDSRCSIDGGESVATDLAGNKRVLGVVGHMCSASSISASPIYTTNHIPMISPSSTSISLTSTKTANINRTVWNEKDQASHAAKFLRQTLQISRVLLVRDKSSYGKDLAETFESTFIREGGLVVAALQISTQADISRAVDSVGSLDPDALYFAGSLSSGTQVLSMLRNRYPGRPLFMGTDTIGTTAFINSSLGKAEDTMCTKFRMYSPAGPEYEDFKRSYIQQFGIDPSTMGPFHTHSYDATMIMLEGIHQASRIETDGSLVVGKKSLVDAIRGTSNYDGLSGTISFDSHGDGGRAELDVYIVKDGNWVLHELAPETTV